MKIMLVEILGDGGIAHYTMNLARALANEKLEIILLTAKKYEYENASLNFSVHQSMFKMARCLTTLCPLLDKETPISSCIRKIVKLIEYPINILEALLILKKNKIRLAHFQSVNELELLMIIFFKLFGIRIIYTIHNIIPRHKTLKTYHILIYRIIYHYCDYIIIHSAVSKHEAINLFSVNPQKISVIPHGDYKFFLPAKPLTKNDAKCALGIPKTCKTLLFFGAIRSSKGLDTALHALSLIKKIIPDIKLLIVGEPCDNYLKYKNIISRENIQDLVFEKLDYIPHDKVHLYFSASDLVILPYKEISQSGVLQIAYAFGKPVIASAIGGFEEAIENDKNGYLVPSGDINALSEKIVVILSDDTRIENMGNYSRHLSDTKYSWKSISKQTIKIYENILNCSAV